MRTSMRMPRRRRRLRLRRRLKKRKKAKGRRREITLEGGETLEAPIGKRQRNGPS